MKTKKIICISLLLLSSLFTGCWNSRELDKLAIVQAIGIDSNENGGVLVTVQILKPSEVKSTQKEKSGGGGSGVWTISKTGLTIHDALRNITYDMDRALFGSHNKVVIIGEETAKSGIGPLLDFFNRDNESRRLLYILTAKGTAKEVIEGQHEQEKIPAKSIEGLIETTGATSKQPKININDFLKLYSSKTGSGYMAGITVEERQIEGEVKKLLTLDETAIFKEDKLVDWFDGRETRGLLWILGKVKSGVIIVPTPGDEIMNVSTEIVKSSSRIKPEMVDGKIVITVEVKEEANISEQMSQKVDLTKPENFKELKKRHAAAIKDEINLVIKKAQKELGVDIFQFGEAVHRKFPREWKTLEKNWPEVYQNIEVRVVVDAELKRFGLSTSPNKAED